MIDTLAGVALALAGLGVWQRRRPVPSILLLACSALWFAVGVVQPLVLAHRGPLTHLLVGYPRGRLAGKVDRAVVAIGYAAALAYPVGRSGVATVLATLLGTLMAFALVRHSFRGRSTSNLLIFLPMATPWLSNASPGTPSCRCRSPRFRRD